MADAVKRSPLFRSISAGEPDRPDTPDEAAIKEEARFREARRQQALAICVHMSMNVGAMISVLAARPVILRSLLDRPHKVAQTMAYITSLVGATEFVLNPVAGHLSDILGRKLFLLQSPVVSILLKLAVYLRPSMATVVAERVLCGACTTIGGSTASQTALADLIEDPSELGQAYSLLGSATGVGVMLGPIIGALVASEAAPTRAYLAGAAVSAAQLAWTATMVDETLELPSKSGTPAPNGGRRDGGYGAAVRSVLATLNPFAFVELYQRTPALAALVTTGMLQCFCEGKSISDLKSYYFLNDVSGFTLRARSLYQTVWGAVMALSGVVGKATIRRLGMHGHTTLQNVVTCVAFAIVSSAGSVPAVFASLPLYLFAMERRAAVSAWAMKEAERSGMGRGEYSAAFFNLRAIACSVAPLLYVRAYSSGVRAVPRAAWRPWALAIAFAAAAEGMHQGLRHSKTLTLAGDRDR